MKKFKCTALLITVFLLISSLGAYAGVAGENTTNNAEMGVFAELEYRVLANTVTVSGQAPYAKETDIMVWLKEDGTGNTIVIRQFKSAPDGSFERKFLLNGDLYDSENTATLRVAATDTNIQTITDIPLFSEAEIQGCVDTFGQISGKEDIGAFFVDYADILDLRDEEGNAPQYDDEDLETLYEIYTMGDYSATDTEGVLAAIDDIVSKFTRRILLVEEINAAADGGDGAEVKRLLTSKYASILTFSIDTSKLIKPDEMWLRMTESTLTDGLGNVLGSEKNYTSMDDIKAAYEEAYALQYECDSSTGGIVSTDRMYNFVEFDEEGNRAWKISYSANIITLSGRHERPFRANIAITVVDSTTESQVVLLHQEKCDAEGNFTAVLPINTARIGDETTVIIKVGSRDTNIWQFFVPVFSQDKIDMMIDAFCEIGSYEEFCSFLSDYYEILRMGDGLSEAKLKVMYGLYTENDYSDLEDAVDVVTEINSLITATTDILDFIDEINEAVRKKQWGNMRTAIETTYAYLADSVESFRELYEASKNADVKSFKGLYNRMMDKKYATIEEIKEAFDKAYKEQYDFENQPEKKPSGGSGGGGGGGNVSLGGVSNIINTPTEPEEHTPSGSVIPEGVDSSRLPVAPFTDITDAYSWASESINGLRNGGVIFGDGDGTFRPGDNMTREEFLTILLRTYGIEPQYGYVEFSDVQEGAWYYDAVATAYEMGISNGMGNNTFGIGQKITRTDAVVLAARLAEKLGIKFPQKEKAKIFNDYTEIPEYGYKYVVLFQQSDFINGDTAGYFNPLNPVTRAEASVIFWNIFGYVK